MNTFGGLVKKLFFIHLEKAFLKNCYAISFVVLKLPCPQNNLPQLSVRGQFFRPLALPGKMALKKAYFIVS
jgi:hypothetical protein